MAAIDGCYASFLFISSPDTPLQGLRLGQALNRGDVEVGLKGRKQKKKRRLPL